MGLLNLLIWKVRSEYTLDVVSLYMDTDPYSSIPKNYSFKCFNISKDNKQSVFNRFRTVAIYPTPITFRNQNESIEFCSMALDNHTADKLEYLVRYNTIAHFMIGKHHAVFPIGIVMENEPFLFSQYTFNIYSDDNIHIRSIEGSGTKPITLTKIGFVNIDTYFTWTKPPQQNINFLNLASKLIILLVLFLVNFQNFEYSTALADDDSNWKREWNLWNHFALDSTGIGLLISMFFCIFTGNSLLSFLFSAVFISLLVVGCFNFKYLSISILLGLFSSAAISCMYFVRRALLEADYVVSFICILDLILLTILFKVLHSKLMTQNEEEVPILMVNRPLLPPLIRHAYFFGFVISSPLLIDYCYFVDSFIRWKPIRSITSLLTSLFLFVVMSGSVAILIFHYHAKVGSYAWTRSLYKAFLSTFLIFVLFGALCLFLTTCIIDVYSMSQYFISILVLSFSLAIVSFASGDILMKTYVRIKAKKNKHD